MRYHSTSEDGQQAGEPDLYQTVVGIGSLSCSSQEENTCIHVARMQAGSCAASTTCTGAAVRAH